MKPNNKQLMYESPDSIVLIYTYKKVNEECRYLIDARLCDSVRFLRRILQQTYWKIRDEIK